uniref:NADH-ubiquinone oxidoreductase chain 2 n=1 Tax=Carnegiella strigata TaxID=642546 RepID=F7UIF5_9TELE|nr:NADH dehydrogenase subunit 2 [Carnegiella strigata]
MNPYVLTMFFTSLGLGTTITFASSHWLLAWMGLEINTLAIIPLMAQHHHPRAIEASTKYFLTQATAAAMILFASTMNAWITGEWNIMDLSHPVTTTITMMALSLKLGLAPLHLWLPEVLQGLDLMTGLILSTWQKLAPFAILIQISHSIHPLIPTTLGVLSALIGGWGGLNQTQLRKTMAYSSIAHLGWMMVILQLSPNLTTLTLFIYIVLTTTTFLLLKLTSSTKIKTLTLSWSKNPFMPSITILTLLSLGGLPPLTGFMPKWLILQELSNQNLPIIATLMAFSALLSLYFYLRLCYNTTLTISPATFNSTTPWRLPSSQNTIPLSLMSSLTSMLLPLTPLILILF